MNKLIFLTLIFISCESEDSADDSNNSSNSDSSVLVKTITTTTNDGDYSNVITEEYFYEGNKIERKLTARVLTIVIHMKSTEHMITLMQIIKFQMLNGMIQIMT